MHIAYVRTHVRTYVSSKVGQSLDAGRTIKANIQKHDDIMVQTAEKGSYKVETLLEFLDWALPVAEILGL